MTKRLVRLLVVVGCLGIGITDAAADSATKVAAGGQHTCALTTAGGVVCWGGNGYGQLGDGTTTSQSTPTPVSGLASGVADIAVGYDHTCARTAGGAVLCWGFNGDGELGDGSTTDRVTPTLVSGLSSGVLAIEARGWHTCAVTTGGTALCWGRNDYGQLGDGTTTSQSTPTQVSGLESGVVALAAGAYHTCALTTGGAVQCWGDNITGQLGDGTTTNRLTPVVSVASDAAAVTASGYHTCAVTTGGAVLCWGWNDYGQLGDGTTTSQSTPTQVSGLESGVAALTAGAFHTCVRTDEGAALCWGANWSGQLGDGTTTSQSTPTQVSGLESGVAVLAGGVYHTCAVTTDRAVLCWGYNLEGELGDGTTTDRWTPTPVSGLEGGKTVPGDVTGDQKADLLWRHGTQGDMWLWAMDGAAPASQSYVSTVGTAYAIVATGDFDGDEMMDVLWRGTAGDMWLWTMNGSTVAGQTYVATVDQAYVVVGAGDFDGDGMTDLLWRGAAGDMWMWLMNGAVQKSTAYVTTVDLSYTVRGVGDLDGDGRADLVWQGAAGDLWAWLMNGAAQKGWGYLGTVADTSYQIEAVADFDGDWKADLLWRNSVQGDMWLWRMDGTTKQSDAYVTTVDAGYQIVGVEDYDGDGKSDLLWRGTAGDLWMWLMNGATTKSSGYTGTVSDAGYQIVNR